MSKYGFTYPEVHSLLLHLSDLKIISLFHAFCNCQFYEQHISWVFLIIRTRRGKINMFSVRDVPGWLQYDHAQTASQSSTSFLSSPESNFKPS